MRAARTLPDRRAVIVATVPFKAAMSPPSSVVFVGQVRKGRKVEG